MPCCPGNVYLERVHPGTKQQPEYRSITSVLSTEQDECTPSANSGTAVSPPPTWLRPTRGGYHFGARWRSHVTFETQQGCNREGAEATGRHGEKRFPGASRERATPYRAKRHSRLLRMLRWPPRPRCYTYLVADRRRRHHHDRQAGGARIRAGSGWVTLAGSSRGMTADRFCQP